MSPYQIRQKQGLTQSEFAKLVGVTVRTISRWETGKAKPTQAIQRVLDSLVSGRHELPQATSQKSKISGERELLYEQGEWEQ